MIWAGTNPEESLENFMVVHMEDASQMNDLQE